MKNVHVYFEILYHDKTIPVRWTHSSRHLVFYVKMDFTQKVKWAKDGHKTPEPDYLNISVVMSREIVCIDFKNSTLNDIDFMAAEINNTYLQASSSQKHYIKRGAEFGSEHIGKVALIR